MFSNFVALLSVASLVGSVAATPVQANASDNVVRGIPMSPYSASFENWQGLTSLHGFDDFYGVGNFDGSRNQQKIIEKQVQVCRVQQIVIVQQRLAILRELTKRVVTELVCDTETQLIVFEQFRNSVGHFKDDLGRYAGRSPGYDRNIAGHMPQFFDATGELSTNDLGFSGKDIDSNTVVYGGSNWNDLTSPKSVSNALVASGDASYPTSDQILGAL